MPLNESYYTVLRVVCKAQIRYIFSFLHLKKMQINIFDTFRRLCYAFYGSKDLRAFVRAETLSQAHDIRQSVPPLLI